MDGVDVDTQLRAAALEAAVTAYSPDEVMVATPGGRCMPVAEEIVETARVFEAYLRGAVEPDAMPAEKPRQGPSVEFIRLSDLLIGGESLDDHLARCSNCRARAAGAGMAVPPWLGGRSGG